MKVTDENMIDAGDVCPETLHLQLGRLPAVDQKMMFTCQQQLRGMMPPIGRRRRIRSQYFQLECQGPL